MNKISTTQTTNFLAFSGLIVILLKYLGVEVIEADIQTIIGAIIAIIGVISNYIHRYSKKDLGFLGNRL